MLCTESTHSTNIFPWRLWSEHNQLHLHCTLPRKIIFFQTICAFYSFLFLFSFSLCLYQNRDDVIADSSGRGAAAGGGRGARSGTTVMISRKSKCASSKESNDVSRETVNNYFVFQKYSKLERGGEEQMGREG